MKLKTFYNIFYRHRIQKASNLHKLYLFITLLIRYIVNLYYLPKKKNLDNFSEKNSYLFNKDLNFLCEYFNSDKGENFKNQYAQPLKQDSKKSLHMDMQKFMKNT